MVYLRAGMSPRMLRSIAAACISFVCLRVTAAEPIFPKPLHLVREITESIGGSTSRIDQYFAGDKAITIRGDSTVIADYARQELTEIDRTSGTYSVASFARVAAARPSVPQARQSVASDSRPSLTERGSDHVAGRSARLFAGESAAENLHLEIAVDPSATLSRDAFDIVAGMAFPNRAGASGVLMREAARANDGQERFALPLQIVSRFTVAGETATVTNRVITVDSQLPPDDLVVIPHGARQVESRAIRARQISDDSESLVPLHPEH